MSDGSALDLVASMVALGTVFVTRYAAEMQGDALDVMIIGAGTGGLCLAQGLRAAGVRVRVFERDRLSADRLQGFRLHISATGNRALQACLPAATFERFVAASAKPNLGVSFFDHRLSRLLSIDIPQVDPAAPESERPISRIALRRMLLDGLEDVVQFGKRFVRFEDAPDGRITARFEDGGTATGDVLVGADGAGSRVRSQLLPQARRIDTGIVAVSGKLALDEAARRETPPAVFLGPTMVLGPHGCFMFASAVEYPPERSSPEYEHEDREEYVMWGFSALRQTLGLPRQLEGVSSEMARTAVLGRMSEWNPALRHLVERAGADTLDVFAVKSSWPIQPWETRNVTLLGDALHDMTPFRGVGANTALRDAAALSGALVAVDKEGQSLLPALATYEREMIDYGFGAVRASLAEMRRLHADSAIRRFATKMMFRAVGVLPPLAKAVRGKR